MNKALRIRFFLLHPMPRAKIPKQVLPDKALHYTAEDVRIGTSQLVAEYRAERLKCDMIADLGCGVGFQSFAFAKTCQKVFAVERDARKLETARKNAEALGFQNITFLEGDALDPFIIKKLKSCEIIFCDTERPLGEARRTMETIQPNPLELLQAYSTITPQIAIELPPFLQDIPLAGEREYLSVHRALSRLTVYCGTLAKAERSVVLLPGRERLESAKKKTRLKTAQALDGFSYLYDINPAILQAGLLAEVSNTAGNKLELYAYEKKQFFCSKRIVKSPFLRAYEILAVVPRETSEIRQQLLQLNAGKVILRQSLDPREYWKERKKYEAGLTGKRMVSLFMLDKAIIAETML